MTIRTVTLRATNAAGFSEASAGVDIADAPGSGNVIEKVGPALGLSTVDPDPTRAAPYSGVGGQAGFLSTTGMAFSPFYGTLGGLAIVGGGHADYGGNECYVFELDSMTWKRINEPSTALEPVFTIGTPSGADVLHGELRDGTPMSCHGYANTIVIPGGNKGLLLMHSSLALIWSGGFCSGWSHAVDLETGARTRFSTNEQPVQHDASGNAINGSHAVTYDVAAGRVYGVPRGGFHDLFSYLDLATRAHVRVPFGASNLGYNPCATQHPVGGLMLLVGGYGTYNQPHAFQLGAIDLANTARGLQTLRIAGDIPPAMVSPCQAIDWDTDRNVGYVFSANSTYDGPASGDNAGAYRLEPPTDLLGGTWTLTRIQFPEPMPANNTDGSYSRWRYIPTLKKFAYVPTNRTQVRLWTPPA